MGQAYAHSRNGLGNRQDLVSHLRNVAEIAAAFAADFGAAEVARCLGLYHDLGKFDPAFQDYLLACEVDPLGSKRQHPDHKAAGAQLAVGRLGLLALAIQGHHGGLRKPAEFKSWLASHSQALARTDVPGLARQAMPDINHVGKLPMPERVERDPAAAEMFLRMLFSTLVDADFLDTEGHFEPERTEYRGTRVSMLDLWERFEADQGRFAAAAGNAVAQARAEIYQHCLDAAEQPAGLFRLTVPTGGGKTRSGMAFALRHALRHGQERIIVAVPYTSITEQTADVYRKIFGEDAAGNPIVLEHHSAVERRADGKVEDENSWARLAAENWDAPIVVTTTVQLFESLFASKPSRCRKVHSLARSVIILDEAQALPVHLLVPILDGLRELCAYYRTTVVISTATQPAYDVIPGRPDLGAREIVPDPTRFFDLLKRVEYAWLMEDGVGWSEVADLMLGEEQALVVVNTKKDAMALLDVLDDADALHLSTLLCGAHRRYVIGEVRRRLSEGLPCRLVSTQVIEAGVDLDFPLVLRALSPLVSIVQAAGRCNREGILRRGRCIVFRPAEGGLPPGAYRVGADLTRTIYGAGNLDLHDIRATETYFTQLFTTVGTDREKIQQLRKELDFPEVARKFRMIDDDTESVAVMYGFAEEQHEVRKALDQLRTGTAKAREILRSIQPYLVSLHSRQAAKYRADGMIAPVIDGVGEWLGKYDGTRGLVSDDLDPDALVV